MPSNEKARRIHISACRTKWRQLDSGSAEHRLTRVIPHPKEGLSNYCPSVYLKASRDYCMFALGLLMHAAVLAGNKRFRSVLFLSFVFSPPLVPFRSPTPRAIQEYVTKFKGGVPPEPRELHWVKTGCARASSISATPGVASGSRHLHSLWV